MPMYDFKCTSEKCSKEFEENVKLSEFDTKEVKCPDCGEKANRQLAGQRATHTSWKHWRL